MFQTMRMTKVRVQPDLGSRLPEVQEHARPAHWEQTIRRRRDVSRKVDEQLLGGLLVSLQALDRQEAALDVRAAKA
jgi:hypothetical protein